MALLFISLFLSVIGQAADISYLRGKIAGDSGDCQHRINSADENSASNFLLLFFRGKGFALDRATERASCSVVTQSSYEAFQGSAGWQKAGFLEMNVYHSADITDLSPAAKIENVLNLATYRNQIVNVESSLASDYTTELKVDAAGFQTLRLSYSNLGEARSLRAVASKETCSDIHYFGFMNQLFLDELPSTVSVYLEENGYAAKIGVTSVEECRPVLGQDLVWCWIAPTSPGPTPFFSVVLASDIARSGHAGAPDVNPTTCEPSAGWRIINAQPALIFQKEVLFSQAAFLPASEAPKLK